MDAYIAAAALICSIALPGLAWLLADARSKGEARANAEATARREKDEAVAFAKRDAETKELTDKVARLELATALDHQTVDGFCDRLDAMREDFDKRFDRIESLIVKGR